MIEINSSRSGGEIEVKVAEPFEIVLNENRTTGYRWQLCSPNGPLMELRNDLFEPPEATNCGGSGMRRLCFCAVQEGTIDIQLDYRRSWERNAAETFTVRINATK